MWSRRFDRVQDRISVMCGRDLACGKFCTQISQVWCDCSWTLCSFSKLVEHWRLEGLSEFDGYFV